MPWVKGQSGNAKGRPKGSNTLATVVRAQTKQGVELVEFAMTLLRDVAAEMPDRLDALKWLADRGWGKAVETVVLDDDRTTAAPDSFPAPDLEDGLGPTGVVQ